MTMLDKHYWPADVEAALYKRWEDAGVFAARPEEDRPRFTIAMPPPNVTGSLHLGHALNHTLQDVLIRYKRMRGFDALWQPGTDHAGIATQMVVERQLAEEGKTRHDLGREAFVDRVWKWKQESGGTIVSQLRRLGTSPDWERERFTLDEGLSRAVRRVFVALHREGLIYRDKRLVNWDPVLHTAISDLEVESRETRGHLWHFRYPLADGSGSITVATTRPETMLGDTAVAVHPDDARYRDIVGRKVRLPIMDREIPIVADDYADPETGSGAVKITPAHDFNDFEVGRRHSLDLINVLDDRARLNENAPPRFRGLDRFEAREKIVEEMDRLGLLEKVEDHIHMVPYGDRSGVIIEPWLTDQWYVDAKTLARPAIEAVEGGRTRFVPEHWANTYFEWMRNIQPWCVSRQLWWGHQIPAWYGPDGEIFVAETEEDAHRLAEARYGEKAVLVQDEDVLDTWFSSALWPFSTLGWPDQTEALETYYPTDVLLTGFDIIFFWVARMMMMGLHFMEDVPFHTVYIHALVRDAQGQKMSKSKGNIIDPLELIDTYGGDALRFTLASLAAPGRDVKMSEGRVEGSRNFITKLWNAARYAEMNDCRLAPDFDPAQLRLPANLWISSELHRTVGRVTDALEAFRFNEAAQTLYHFIWGTFCDWYLEITKSVLQSDDAAEKAEVRATTAWVLDRLLHLIQPFTPFVAEELWSKLGFGDEAFLMSQAWPDGAAVEDRDQAVTDACKDLEWVIRFVSSIRTVRGEMNVPPGAQVPLFLKGAGDDTRARLVRHGEIVQRLARISSIDFQDAVPKGAVQTVVDEATLMLPLMDVIDVDQEKARLKKEMSKLEADITRLDKKLSNAGFLEKAPAEVVAEQRQRRDEAADICDKLGAALARFDRL